jgi:transaldolase
MKATQKLHDLGQSIWLDNITRDLLTSGTLQIPGTRVRRWH